jgi:AAA15 family ATPase/GTPase
MTPTNTPVDGQPSVLLSFRARNIRSFRDQFEISFLATTLAEAAVVRQVTWRDRGAPIGVLPAACIFGANAAGKSNALRAMDDMRAVVLRSFRFWSPTGGTRRRPFLLGRAAQVHSSSFEIDLVVDGVRYEYGFELDDERIIEEWAFRYPKGRPALLFRREGMNVNFGSSVSPKASTLVDLLRDNALLLSTAAAVRQPDLLPLFLWFQRNLRLAEAESRPIRHAFTTELIDKPLRREQVLALLQAADLGIVDVSKKEIDPVIQERMEHVVRILTEGEEFDASVDTQVLDIAVVRLHHRGLDGEVEFDVSEESLGTLVWLGLVGPIVDSLSTGSVLLADELDASLHPALVEQVVRLFQNPHTNPHRAQIVFNSHDTTLLGDASGERLLGRDQVWFAEKSHDGSTRLFPLSDLDPRKEEAVGRRYLAGRYGATPIISSADFDSAAELITAGK